MQDSCPARKSLNPSIFNQAHKQTNSFQLTQQALRAKSDHVWHELNKIDGNLKMSAILVINVLKTPCITFNAKNHPLVTTIDRLTAND